MLKISMMIALAVSLPATARSAEPATNNAIGEFNHCVRRAAVRLEPSDAPPEDIGRAAVGVCLNEEVAATNLLLHDPSAFTPDHLRSSAIELGVTEVVVARLCRKTHDCALADARRVP